jgi:cytochrome c553
MNPTSQPLRLAVLAAALLATAALPAAAQDAQAGRAKAAQTCNACHGPNGIASQPDAANLAGQSAYYIGTQLRAFRSGERVHELMAMMAKPLSDADIADLAAWYASIKIDVHVPN